MSRRRHRIPWAFFLAPIAALLLSPVTGARAQTPSPPSTGPPQISLVAFPSFLPPGGTLQFEIEASNPSDTASLTGLAVTVSFRDRVKNRTSLKRTFDPRPGFPPEIGSDTFPLEGSLGPGETRRFTVTKPLPEISFFRTRTASGAYPLRIVLSTDASRSAPIETHMILFASDGSPPLGLALVIPLHSAPIYTDPNRPTVVTSSSLDRSIERGRLARILGAMASVQGAALTIAPSGMLLDMLDDLADGSVRQIGGDRASRRVPPTDPSSRAAANALELIGSIGAKEGNEIVLSPYSGAVLPSLVKAGLPARAQAQVGQTRLRIDPDPENRVARIEASPAQGWVLPVAGLIDEPTMAELQQSSVTRAILSASSLRDPGELLTTRPAPVQIATRAATPVTAVITDASLSQRLTAKLSPIEIRQGFLAETVTIMLEFPGQTRVVTAVAPHDWNPPGDAATQILGSAANVPWLRTTTPSRALADIPLAAAPAAPGSRPIRPRLLELGATDALLDRALPDATQLTQPPAEYFTSVRDAVDQISRYAELDPPSERLALLERQLLIAESSSWWTRRSQVERGRRFATAITPAVNREFDRIKAPDDQPITLTSRTGVIPLSIRSGLEYPVDVVVRLRSSKLTFPRKDNLRPCSPGSRDACLFIEKLPPRSPPIEVTTETQATGTFALHLVVETPGGVTLDESDLTIRSTAYSIVALGITSGAAVFMISWWLAGLARKRIPA